MKKVIFAILIGLGVSFNCFTESFAQNMVVNNQIDVTNTKTNSINWNNGVNSDIEAIGIGMPPVNMPSIRANALARRAAIVDAYRQLAETVQGVQVDAETTMKDLSIESDIVRTKTQALINGARIVEEKANLDGSYTVKLSIPLYGVKSVASIVIPEANKTLLPDELPKITDDYVASVGLKDYKSIYTGVIIDASGLGLEGTFSPIIFDTNGRAIYGMRSIDKDFAISHGMVEYYNDLHKASVNSRAGVNPLMVKAVSVRGGGNSINNVNVVISIEDGDKILYANESSNMLEEKAVVFVK